MSPTTAPSEVAVLEYAAMYEVCDPEATTAEAFTEAKLRWVADVVALDCRPSKGGSLTISTAEVEGSPWVQITAPVYRVPGGTWPEHKPFRTNK